MGRRRKTAEARALRRLQEDQASKFRQRRHHGSWEGMDPMAAFDRMIEEAAELREELVRSPRDERRVRAEAADVANFAAIVSDLVSTDSRACDAPQVPDRVYERATVGRTCLSLVSTNRLSFWLRAEGPEPGSVEMYWLGISLRIAKPFYSRIVRLVRAVVEDAR